MTCLWKVFTIVILAVPRGHSPSPSPTFFHVFLALWASLIDWCTYLCSHHSVHSTYIRSSPFHASIKCIEGIHHRKLAPKLMYIVCATNIPQQRLIIFLCHTHTLTKRRCRECFQGFYQNGVCLSEALKMIETIHNLSPMPFECLRVPCHLFSSSDDDFDKNMSPNPHTYKISS